MFRTYIDHQKRKQNQASPYSNGKCFFVLQNGKTALHHCANNLDTDNTDSLLSHGAQPNTIDKVSKTESRRLFDKYIFLCSYPLSS